MHIAALAVVPYEPQRFGGLTETIPRHAPPPSEKALGQDNTQPRVVHVPPMTRRPVDLHEVDHLQGGIVVVERATIGSDARQLPENPPLTSVFSQPGQWDSGPVIGRDIV